MSEGEQRADLDASSLPPCSFRFSPSVEGKKYFVAKKNYGIFVSLFSSLFLRPNALKRGETETRRELTRSFDSVVRSLQVRPEKVTVGDFPEEDFMDEDEEEI